MILVLGSTGTVGRHVVSGLAAAGERVRAFTRDPAGARFGDGVEVVEGDVGVPGTVMDALTGVDAVFVGISSDVLPAGPGVADAVRRRGIRRVVQLSSVVANAPVVDPYGKMHAAAERAFAESGAELTVLRSAGFMSNVLQWCSTVASQDRVYQQFAAIPRAVVDPADVAATAVACLTGAGHGGRTYQVTGPEALTARDMAAKLSAALGRPLRFTEVRPEEARELMIGAGTPPDIADALLLAMSDPDPQRGGVPLPTVREVTGRPPATFDAWLERHLPAFRG
jgi:uncharacterized protein YbjT (DUF2867 family)